jgi:flavin-dependent dehydrogenase
VADHRWPEEIVLMYDNDYPAPGYFWIFSKGKGSLNAGIGWEKTQELGKLKERFNEELHKHYSPDEYTVLKRGGGQIPFRPPFDSLVVNGGALAGDAACMVHPVTAEGHGPALDTGAHLGKSLISALDKNRRDRLAIWSYNEKVASHYGRKHAEAEIMKRFLSQVGADGLRYLIEKKIFQEDELNLIFSGGALEISLWEQIKRVFKLIPKPKIMLGIRVLLKLSDQTKKIYSQYPSSPDKLNEWREHRNTTLGLRV